MVQGVIAYYGTYTISEPGIVKLHIVSCSFPNWNGTDQARAFVIAGDEMQYTNPTTSFGGSSGRLAWKRGAAGTMTQP
jgi:Lipocalin-like domain